MTHRHGEAFMLMWYQSADGTQREQVWNSRDGAAPHEIRSAATGVELRRRSAGVQYLPDHVPAVGDRIFVDLTEQRARIVAAGVIEQYRTDGKQAELDAMFASYEEAVEILSQSMLEMGAGDLITVTSGYIEELLQVRGRGADPEVVLRGWDRASGSDWSALGTVLPGREPHFRCKPHGRAYCTECAKLPPTRDAAVGKSNPFISIDAGYYYDRQGQHITQQQYFERFEDDAYRIVKHTAVAGLYVSTIWLGFDHNWHRAERSDPIIFETSVFRTDENGMPSVSGGPLVQQRDHTETEARETHERVVRELRTKGN